MKLLLNLHVDILELKYQVGKRYEALIRWIAWHLPKRLIMWCYMRVAANATTGRYENTNACDLSMMDAIKRWDE